MPDSPASPRIPYRVRVSARAKRMRIIVRRDGVEVVVPERTSAAVAERFVADNRDWIERALARLPPPEPAEPPPPPDPFADLPLFARAAPPPPANRIETIALQGLGRTIAVKYLEAPMLRAKATMTEPPHRPDTLVIYCANPLEPPRRAVRALLKEWVREQARTFLPGYIDALADELGIRRPSDIRIGFQRTLWGSRSTTGRISLSATLLFLPPHLLRHVAVHELCHTLHMDHGPRFHEALARHDPLADRHAAELKTADAHVPSWLRTP
ncbi:MAG: M48 family metallopeptidase [Kiritimatiellia bacterium]|jgi:predicted metal-dependent hydrolase